MERPFDYQAIFKMTLGEKIKNKISFTECRTPQHGMLTQKNEIKGKLPVYDLDLP